MGFLYVSESVDVVKIPSEAKTIRNDFKNIYAI